MDLSELLAKHDQGDLLRGIAEAVLQLIMEADVDGLMGADHSPACRSTGRWDHATVVDITLDHGMLTNTTELDLLAGANLLAVEGPSGWELLKAREADSWEGFEVPLGEEVEGYNVTIHATPGGPPRAA
jgi:hypothetical protein